MFDNDALNATGHIGDSDSYDNLRDKIGGVLLGSAVADALGWPTEFLRSRKQLSQVFDVTRVEGFIPWDKPTGGRFNTYMDHIRPGDYSDDTQLTLCTARCIRFDGSFDVNRFAKTELPMWHAYSRGAGATINRAARNVSKRKVTWNNNFFSFESRGHKSTYQEAGANGAAMRIAPIALANRYNPEITKSIWKNAIVTHGHPRAIWGALVYAHAVLILLDESDLRLEKFTSLLRSTIEKIDLKDLPDIAEEWMERWSADSGTRFEDSFEVVRDEMLELLEQAFRSRELPLSDMYETLGCFAAKTKVSGTGTVAAAIGVYLKHGGSYERAVLESVNMIGSDTDTIAAMVGGLVCARAGEMAIPDRWANTMQDYPYFGRVAEALTRIAMREASANDLAVDHKREEFEGRDIVSLASSYQVYEQQRITHPIFGLGWVNEVTSQQIKRRGGGTMLLARVVFDMGQSCVFKSYRRATP